MKTKRKSLTPSVLFEMWELPCAVCGATYGICADHILPVARGGTNERSNIQPLCWQCNHIKCGKVMTNDEILQVVKQRPDHYLRGEWKRAHRFNDRSDMLSFHVWKAMVSHV